jgi:RND family efflux transporter MFP subunit
MVNLKAALLAGTILAAVVGIGAAAAIGLGTAAGEADSRQGAQLVQIAIVKPAQSSERAFTGIISARVQSNLGFRVPGKVIERLVDTGENVHAGQVLMRLDQKDLDLALTAREKAVVSARAVAVQAKADEMRYRRLLASGWVAQQKYDQIKAAFDSATAQLAAAEAQAQVAKNEAGYSLLLADADGTIVETLAEPGQVVTAGQTVVRLAHSGPREATVNLPETVRPVIGSPAQVQVYGASAAASPARLRQLSDAADVASRTYEARYVLEGEASKAPLGATVTLRVVAINEAADDVEVPLGALYDNGKAPGVWVFDRESSSVSFHAVQVRRLAEETAVISGVRTGESVVALGAHLLHPGDRVRIAEERIAAQ